MRQIHSESQRLLRETEISLPYHRPKQRTLQEFLNRRNILSTLPKAPSTAAKLKMSSAIVSQVLAEKEKEAELFYKSSKCIQDPNRIGTGTQESQDNNKEIVQKDHLDLKETLPYKKVPASTDNSEFNKPGAKLIRLKEDLKLQMTLKRNKEWKQKEMELQAEEEEEDWNGEEESGHDSDEEEKANMGFESSNSGESEPEENDICISQIHRHSDSSVRNKTILKKKLFDDIGETIDDEYLMQLCSGKFESTQRTDLDLFSQSNTTQVSQLRSSAELRPGNSNANPVDVKQSKDPKESDNMFQDIKLILDEDSNSVNYAREISKDSAIDSELKLTIASSDDEDDEDTFVKPKRRLVKKFNLSDSEEENSKFSNEEKDDVDSEEAEEQYIDYDSEENEIVSEIPEENIKQVAAGFLEEEAELSESDWDSADEDEKDMDKLEFEEADEEHIDEHEMKNQLEKIHMKQMLDEDKREVRLLKELLFEDGDLHSDGTGRERKFKWRNIDKLGSSIETPQMSDENDGWVDVQEDEEEAKWSKLRYERDKFLEERMKCLNNEIEDELCDSQIFKLGLKAVRKMKDNESQRQDTSLDKADSIENMEPIMPRNITDLLNGPNIGKKSQTIYNIIKKRSLLTRGEESLARIASLAKQGDSAFHSVNKRNFVFPHIDQSTDDTHKKENETAEELDLQIKPGKRKMMSKMVSSTSKKRRK
ncbi:PREDICTED: claspin homolog isoform X2 [Vollenhovia emeryi]|nr:PREDICTED: claspin homolog isoform X2 [Vollenhovia emeryi]XP_011861142.1 PREDICTED: claspin homolog isoform X2 [Vollenhovia emeryi]